MADEIELRRRLEDVADDVGALARSVAALSRLALVAGQPVAEAEINPLIVKTEGVIAVDGLVVVKEHCSQS